MKYQSLLFSIILCMHTICMADISKEALAVKDQSVKAVTDANSAQLAQSANFPTKDEKITAIREKAISAITAAQTAITQAKALIADKKQSYDSQNLATKAQNEAEDALKKAGSILAAS